MRRPALPSPAFCLALLALFVSLGGTTYAIATLPRDSVGTEQIKARAVTEDELSNSAVVSRKIANGAVTDRKIARNAITGTRIAPDSIGGEQIAEASLQAVPFAQDASKAEVAARALVADRVERVARADTAGTAERAQLADVATETAHAEQADQADQAQRAAIANSLASLDINYYNVPAGAFGIFSLECDVAPDLIAISGGYIPDDFVNPGANVVSGGPWPGPDPEPDPGAIWLIGLADPDPGPDTAGTAWVACVKAQDVN
jgi:hypothetical protein